MTKDKLYSVVFHYSIQVEAEDKEEAERLACDDYRLNQPPQLNELAISIEEIEKIPISEGDFSND